MKTAQERFETKFSKAEDGDCWNWVASKDRHGYGMLWFDGRLQVSSRVAYQLYVGKIPSGLCILHHCDNPACVNPDHLFLGTQADNVQDCENKGRGVHPVGEKHARSKLTSAQVVTIREKREAGDSCAALAREYKVSPAAIYMIEHRINWAKT